MKLVILDGVYPPAEDSWQTARILSWVVKHLAGNSTMLKIVDVGSGSGVLTLTAVSESLKNNVGVWVLAIDHDYLAATNTKLNLVNNNLYEYVDVVSTSTLDAIRDNAHFNIIVSNPPYLPGDWSEDWRIFGGLGGIEIAKRLVNEVCIGNKADIVVLTLSSLSDWEEVIKLLRDCNYKLVVMYSGHYFFEDIITIVFIIS
mgnify:CR=1 FL=1